MGNEVRVYGLKHQKEKRTMDHFAGLDVSVKETSVCILDDTGNAAFKRIGSESGVNVATIFSALVEAELPVICVETRHKRAVLKAQINNTGRNDARSIAQICGRGFRACDR